jgi:CheY-like chemotaxis protein
MEYQAVLLVVEDEVLARRALTILLTSNGFETEAVGSAEQALCLIGRGHLPDRAVIDLDLPGMSGAELIRILGQLRPELRPILVTAASPEHIAACLGSMEVPMLQKPIDIHELVGMLKEA